MWIWLRRLLGLTIYDVELPPFYKEVLASSSDMTEVIDWGLKSLNVPEVWLKTEGEGIKIAILDTGIAMQHPDLQDSIIASQDFTGKGSVEDGNGHGTHCAGIAAAVRNNKGIIGVAPKAKIMCAKVLNNRGSGTLDWIVKGIHWAYDEGADIISMSLGSSNGTPALEQAVRKVIDGGKILIVAAGNAGEGSDTIRYPGRYKDVICVGAINREMKRSQFSSTGPNLTIMAPGEQVMSCYPPDTFAKFSGTSMAAPFIAGVAALILSKHRSHGGYTPCATQQQMFEHLTKEATDIDDPGWDVRTGWGIVNPLKSVKKPDNIA